MDDGDDGDDDMIIMQQEQKSQLNIYGNLNLIFLFLVSYNPKLFPFTYKGGTTYRRLIAF